VKLLLEKGSELEAKDEECVRTPLLYAAYEGHEAVMKLLVETGAGEAGREGSSKSQ